MITKAPPPPPTNFLYFQAATSLSAGSGVLVDPSSFFKLLSGRCAQYSIVLHSSVFFLSSHKRAGLMDENNRAKTRKNCCVFCEVHRNLLTYL
jgi:hypothetical protein